jgi:hypothetical protein
MRTLTTAVAVALAIAGAGVVAPSALSAQVTPPEAIVLSPEPGETVAPSDLFVAVSFMDPAGQLDPQSVVLRIGGVDVTAEAELRGGVLTWRPRQPLASGPQRVLVSARSLSGGQLAPASVTFTVSALAPVGAAAPLPAAAAGPAAPAAVPGTHLRGTLVLEGASQTVSGAGADFRRGEEFLPLMWLNAGGVIGSGWRYAARVHVSGYESSVLQPVNRFRFDVRGPFVNLAAGDVTPAFHELILAGRRVRGVQGELWGGPFKVAVVAGESRRAIRGLLDPTEPTAVGRYGTFGQNLFAIRPSIGTGRTFQLGFTALRVRDDVQSITELRTLPLGDGSTVSVNPAPKDNLVGGLDLTLRLGGGRVLLQYDNAISLFANDISGGPLTEAELDDVMESGGYDPVGVDPSSFERFFILNASLIPLNLSGRSNIAQQARASVRAGSHLLVAEWRSVGGSYHTLGYQALPRDRAGLRLRDSFSAANDALVVSLGFERDQDNLDDVKAATTTTSAMFATANWQGTPDGLALYGTARLGTRSNSLSAGQTGALDEQSVALSVGTSVPLGFLSEYRTRLTLNASVVNREDPRNPQSGSEDLYLLGGVHAETPGESSTGSLLFGYNTSELTGFANASTDIIRVAGSARHRLATEWVGILDGSYTMASSPVAAGDLGVDYNRVEALGGVEYTWRATTVIGITGGMISYTDNLFSGRDTREVIARLRVSRTF